MNLIITYDLIFLALFTIAVIIFLHIKSKKGKNLHREGLMYLYKTQVGVKFIDYIGKKWSKQIRSLHYTVITVGYLLFAGILFVIGQTIYLYIKVPEITNVIKTPPLLPLIPYFPQLFGAGSLFPPFYFVYFIIALIIVAFCHEFSHGIFARANDVRIKSTGVAFLGPILGAFVEQDDKQMNKKSKTAQMAILAAGVFANIIMAIIFFLLLFATFKMAFIPAGAIFSTYSYAPIELSSINNITKMSDGMLGIETDKAKFLITDESYKKQIEQNKGFIVAYFDAPAVKNKMDGAIQRINNEKVKDFDSFVQIMDNYKPGDNVSIKTTTGTYDITLASNPTNSSKSFVGIGFVDTSSKKLLTKIFGFKKPTTYYEEKTIFSKFFYDLFWWIAMINFMVGLFNMLPFGFLDGGRFFYLTILGLTKSEKSAQRVAKIATKTILALFLLLLVVWFIALRWK